MKKNAKTIAQNRSVQSECVSWIMKLFILAVLLTPMQVYATKIQNSQVSQQTAKMVRGTVVDNQNLPLIGVNIIIKGTSTGTVTDFDGKFSLEVPQNASLQFSFIGYLNQEIEIGQKKQFRHHSS